MANSDNTHHNKTKNDRKLFRGSPKEWIKRWHNALKKNKGIGYYVLVWSLIMVAAIGLFFTSNVDIEIFLVGTLVGMSIIALFIEKSILKWIIFVISMAVGLFFLNIYYYEEKVPKEIGMSITGSTATSTIDNGHTDLRHDQHGKSKDRIDLVENSKGVISPYLDRKSDWFAIVLALISLIFVAYTWSSQEKTQKNTQRITPDIQKGILKDLFRHSYKNLIVLTAIKIRLQQEGYDNYYPAEYHITKLQTEESAIYPEVFVDKENYCGRLHEMKLFVRNGNLEIKEVINHLKNPDLELKYKERGIDLIGKRIMNILDRTAAILEEMYGMKKDKERAAQIKNYVFERSSNSSKSVQEEFKAKLQEIIDERDTERSEKYSKLCARNTPNNGIIDYSKLVEYLYPNQKWDENDMGGNIGEATSTIITIPETMEGFVKRINAEIFKMIPEIHLIPFIK